MGIASTVLTRMLTAIIERDGDGYVALCPEMDVVSQGDTITEARDNLVEALTLFLETASTEEINDRLRDGANRPLDGFPTVT